MFFIVQKKVTGPVLAWSWCNQFELHTGTVIRRSYALRNLLGYKTLLINPLGRLHKVKQVHFGVKTRLG